MIRRATCWLFAVAMIFSISQQASAYSLTGVKWKTDPVTTVFDESDYTLDLGADATALGQVDTALQNAFDTWADADANDKLSFDRKSDLGGNYDVYDGPGGALDQSSNSLYANITVGGWLPNSYFDSISGGGGSGILAVTWSAKLQGGGSMKPHLEVDIYFNDHFNWSVDGTGIDIETVALHEAGHAIGLGHEDSVPTVMGTYYAGIQRSLYDDDLAGLADLYGSGGGGGGGGGRGGNGGGPGGGGPPGRGLGYDGVEYSVIGVTTMDDYRHFLSTGGLSTSNLTAVPEPSTFVLGAIGLAALAFGYRRRQR